MKTTYKNFVISESFIGNKVSPWDENNYNYHKVTVKNLNNGKKTSFDFWCSIIEQTFKTENDLLFAFYCFLSDADAGNYDLDDFQGEFGYKNVSECIRAWKACRKSLKKCERLFDCNDDLIYEMINDLSEIAG